jgi:hypothetical protein
MHNNALLVLRGIQAKLVRLMDAMLFHHMVQRAWMTEWYERRKFAFQDTQNSHRGTSVVMAKVFPNKYSHTRAIIMRQST